MARWKPKTWSRRQLKKTRWKRSLSRAQKHYVVYGGYVTLTMEMLTGPRVNDKITNGEKVSEWMQ